MRISGLFVVGILAVASTTTRGDDPGSTIDLSSFSALPLGDDAEPLPIEAVAYDSPTSSLRFYLTGIAGASFGTINADGNIPYADTALQTIGSVNETLFNGGGAIGLALARPSGLLRVEVEGRARGPMNGQTTLEFGGVQVEQLDVNATDGWSAMTNFWRDYFFTNRLGVYGGGGFGVGGYQYSMQGAEGIPLRGSSTVNTFAWQVGTGITYQLSDRITLDTGYRFFAMAPGSTPLGISDSGFSIPLGSFTSAFSASELLISIRIYEPFRSWR